jgi:proline dehydrogenase
VGTVIQAYLYRSEEDIEQLIEYEAKVRLCKGAYDEPADVAYRDKAEVNRNFVRLVEKLFSREAKEYGVLPAIASHDEQMIAATKDAVRRNGWPQHAFEFQMLYGVRTELQRTLVDEGYQVRVYVPFGSEWYPYFMRRMAERPANALLVARALLNRH